MHVLVIAQLFTLDMSGGSTQAYNVVEGLTSLGHKAPMITAFPLGGIEVKRFLFSSSACTYPTCLQTDPNVKGLREGDAYPADPDNFYGWEKLFTEKCASMPERPWP